MVLESSDLDIQTENGANTPVLQANNAVFMAVDSDDSQNEIVITPSHCDNNLKQITDDFQAQFITKMLAENNGNSAATARAIGVDRSNLHRLMKRLDIQ